MPARADYRINLTRADERHATEQGFGVGRHVGVAVRKHVALFG
jgi:hypothetical protein